MDALIDIVLFFAQLAAWGCLYVLILEIVGR